MEIFLTKMILNPKCPQVRRDLGNPQELHRTISNGFQKVGEDEIIIEKVTKKNGEEKEIKIKATPRNKFDILYRFDVNRRRGEAILFVQSTAEPNWKALPPDYAFEINQKTVHEQYGRIENGMILMFRLQANPTKRIGKNYQHPDEKKREEFTRKFRDDKNRRRISMNTDEDRIEWLKRKGEEVGFQLANVKVAPIPNVASIEEGKINFRKERNSPNITFGSVVFEGVLQVINAEDFREALQKGIGSGKAYGFGLLSIAPVKER